jgi:hypothetical protein
MPGPSSTPAARDLDAAGLRAVELVNTLRDSSASDLLRGLGLEWASPALEGAARRAVGRFVADIAEMDAAVARGGLSAAADLLLERYAGTVTIRGTERVPATGPVVVVANHVGTVDAPALWRLLAVREDLRIIALDRPFLHAVPHLAARLLYVADDTHGRTGLVRRAAAHLRAGGALLTFPAGTIEPDPALRPEDAMASLATWHNSVELLGRLVPEAAVLPVAVSGVISTRMLRHPLARWRAKPEDRELAAATLQVFTRERSISPVLAAGDAVLPGTGTGALRASMERLLRDGVR